ncbi:phage tail protein [Peribacillus frigoritolerans]|uniref:phage tail protein n=1 Tax=Peribacillus frigoritolerans TaxID=450367 RepID=UPI00207A38AF|nr:phage tail protein [Peribacillus frigoritolerans]USK66316.1 phage tail protein [Peribacillus frigoritolerans]
MYNIGQTSVFLKDLKGQEYPAIAEVNRKRRVNGQREISLSFLYTEINKDFMPYLEFGWKVLFKDEWYTIVTPGKSTDGDFLLVNVTAILSFFVDLNGYYLQDKVENKSYTPGNYFNEVFAETSYSFVLVDAFAATTMTFEDNESKTARFLYGIDRFNAEFKVQGKLVYIHKLVGYDKDVILHEDLNVNNVRMDVDGSGFHTWAKGFGDLPESNGEDEPEYQLEVEYRSPLIAKFGEIEGPALKDGNYKSAENLTAAVKDQVENSYTVSTEVDTVDLSNNGYPEMVFEEGDRIWLVVDRINLNQQVRVMELDETFDWEGNKINAQYVLGNEGIASRYKTQQYDSIKDFRDIVSGRKPLQYDWLPAAVKRAAEIINGNQDSLFKYLAGEIIGINQSNPNGYMRFNTDGIGFSRDGGKTYQTAITYEGIVADAITTGTLRAILLEGVEIIGSIIRSADEGTEFYVEGGNMILSRTNGRKVTINPDGFYGLNGAGEILFKADRGLVTSAALGTSNSNVYLAPDSNNEVRVVDVASIPSDGVAENYTYRPIRAQGLRFGPGANGYIGTEGEVRITSSGFRQDDGSVIYRDLRAAAIYGTAFITTTESAWIGTNSALHVVAKGTAEGDLNPIYRALYAGNIFGTAFITQTENAFIGTNNELRVVNKGLTDIYRDVRANVYIGNSIRVNTGDNLYLGVSGTNDGEVRVTSSLLYNEGNPAYYPIKASEYRNGSSITYKTNIEDLDDVGLFNINKLAIKRYLLQSDVDNGMYDNWQIGVISELSPEVATKDGLAINIYKMLSYSVKAIQELSVKVDTQQQQLTDQELLLTELITQNEAQQQQLTDFASLTESLTSRLAELEERVALLEAK